ncbi:acyltransferase family protein [Paraliobacillus sediminis]|uniref:acyltransferase family protein n=1 Tax=Paraliobacillus sediminis TaxID=1885916 RepID=UPI000E3EC31C|nr:acyltransferase family protein [Paraliobacillus sediminis]
MKRDAFFDNAKFILIFLVVFGHMIQPFTQDSAIMRVSYDFIYLFHMPAFILLSGFFAKGIGNAGYIWNLTKKLVFPYIIFQGVYSAYYYLIGNASWQTPIFQPHWSLWFLLSLFSWHLLLIVFKKMPPLAGIISAVGIGIIVGYINGIGAEYSLSRTFVFFPFFLMGYWITKDQIKNLTHPIVKHVSFAIMSIVVILLVYLPSFSSHWLLGSFAFADLDQPIWGGFIRLGIYLIATILICSLFAWIPRKQYRWTNLGQQTLYVYLLHGLFIQFFREAGWFRVDHILDVFGLAILSLLIVLLLSSKTVFISFQPIIEGRLTQIKLRIMERKNRKDKQVNYQ